jgi:hypothetical protein
MEKRPFLILLAHYILIPCLLRFLFLHIKLQRDLWQELNLKHLSTQYNRNDAA